MPKERVQKKTRVHSQVKTEGIYCTVVMNLKFKTNNNDLSLKGFIFKH